MQPRGRRLAALSLTALGVVYGDIGTTPLSNLSASVSRKWSGGSFRPVIVRDALPVGVQSASTTPGSATARASDSKRYRIGTVARVDQQNEHVWLTDGTALRARPSTQMRMGTAGKTIMLAELRPGDELVIVMEKDGATPPKPDGATGGSALPREVASATPAEASELMVFRDAQAP